METPDHASSGGSPFTFHNFLMRMRDPAAADLVRSIKNFIVSFLGRPPDAELDGNSVQSFMTQTEDTFRGHTLWAGATEEELESAGEGLEKYLMTKLHSRAFAPLPQDAERDEALRLKMASLRSFLKPQHLDISPDHYNEAAWQMAQNELQKMGTYKAPRDKLICILNCCRIVNNLLINAAMAKTADDPGADEFLPLLIYVVAKANPPQLHSNLTYIQRYRCHKRLVSEASYFFTNLVSAATFIESMKASSLTGVSDEEFANHVGAPASDAEGAAPPHSSEQGRISSTPIIENPAEQPAVPAVPGLNVQGSSAAGSDSAAYVAATEASGELQRQYRFLHSRAGDLRIGDIDELLLEYKELVLRHVALCHSFSVARSETTTEASIQQTVPEGLSQSLADASQESKAEAIHIPEMPSDEAALFQGLHVVDEGPASAAAGVGLGAAEQAEGGEVGPLHVNEALPVADGDMPGPPAVPVESSDAFQVGELPRQEAERSSSHTSIDDLLANLHSKPQAEQQSKLDNAVDLLS